ncbi:MAG: hypothetical protein NVS3B12_30070 [Acidimicrobiales bacterium]
MMDLDAVSLNFLKMGTTGDESHVGTAESEPRPEVAANSARTHDRHTHVLIRPLSPIRRQ